jgi:hypothetical protein
MYTEVRVDLLLDTVNMQDQITVAAAHIQKQKLNVLQLEVILAHMVIAV